MLKASLAALAAIALLSGPAPAQDRSDNPDRTPYKVVLQDGNFEIRDYPARHLAEITVVGDDRIAAYRGFRVFAEPTLPPGTPDELASLTTPVMETPTKGEQFGTYSLFQVLSARVWDVSFAPPPGWKPGSLGYQKTPPVRWVDAPPQQIAVMDYDGRGGVWDGGLNWRQVSYDLLTEIARHGYTPQGTITIAQYNAPQTEAVFRHYAVMIAVKRSSGDTPAPTYSPAGPAP